MDFLLFANGKPGPVITIVFRVMARLVVLGWWCFQEHSG